jgi:hypothetical protein
MLLLFPQCSDFELTGGQKRGKKTSRLSRQSKIPKESKSLGLPGEQRKVCKVFKESVLL